MANYIICGEVFSDGTHIFKVTHDINGNPRYIVHWTAFCPSDKQKAIKLAKDNGFYLCRKKRYTDNLITQEYGGFQAVYNRIQQAKKDK